jgi:glycosyltransferase involved in cell wall biosynthesis
MLNYSSFCVSAATTGLFVSRPDVVIGTSPQLLVGLSGLCIARAKRVPFVFEVRDLWPESLAAVGMGNENSVLHRLLAKVAGFLYRNSDHIVVVTQAFEKYLVERWNVPRKKISVVENGVETNLFAPSNESDSLKLQLNAEGKFIVCYIGTMGMAHGLETMVEAADRLRQSAPDVLFLLVGEGADKERIVALAKTRGLDNLQFVDQQPREKIPAYISASDACLVLLRKTDLFKTVIPTKMLEFMSCARPVILGVDGQAREIMDRAQAGIFIEPGNVGALMEAVERLRANPQLRADLGSNGRRHIVDYFSREQTAATYVTVLDQILGRRSTAEALAA